MEFHHAHRKSAREIEILQAENIEDSRPRLIVSTGRLSSPGTRNAF